MNGKKQITALIAILILVVAVMIFCIFEVFDNSSTTANTETKWQGLLEKNETDESSWEKYLPSVTREEYLKVKDYLASFFQKKTSEDDSSSRYTLHKDISTTMFWVGEKASDANHDISNAPSCWDDKWSTHFGGVDKPNKRNGYLPADFKPKENPFYIALPYNDFNSKGNRKSGLDAYIPWYKEKKWGDKESVCKNRWIKIIKGDKVAYGQWEDSGPFGENDVSYVFGTDQPKSKSNDHAGLDVSPAIRDYLNLSDVDKTSWQFVDAKDVPDGPWKDIITSSNIYWN